MKRGREQRTKAIKCASVKEKNVNEFILDKFYGTKPIDYKTDICAMCKGGHVEGLDMTKKFLQLDDEIDDGEDEEYKSDKYMLSGSASIIDPEGVWASMYSLHKKNRVFVHLYCALNSPQSWWDGVSWHNLSKEVTRSRGLTCKTCSTRGPTIGCYEAKCSAVVHVPCAIQIGFSFSSLHKSFKFFCPTHLTERRRAEGILDKKVSDDLSRGREPVPIIVRPEYGGVDAVPFFEYTTTNLDSEDIVATIQNVSTLECCDCTGICNDVNLCKCLRVQRNYANNGVLIGSKSKPLFECNEACACSIRRCTNRVTGRGVRADLEVFRRSESVSLLLSSDNQAGPVYDNPEDVEHWGVKTNCAIPAGAFVCEMTGQYVRGRSVVSYITKKGVVKGVGRTVADDFLVRCFSEAAAEHRVVNAPIAPVSQWQGGEGKVAKEDVCNAWRHGRDHLMTFMAMASGGANSFMQLPIPPVSVAESASLIESQSQVDEGRGSDSAVEELKTGEDISRRNFREMVMDDMFIDTRYFGNVCRFIKHRKAVQASTEDGSSAEQESRGLFPQLERRLVFSNAADMRFPRLALFAGTDIPAGAELIL